MKYQNQKEIKTDHPIRVLCVFSSLNRGGAESMCMNLYRHIDRKQVQFDFVKHDGKKGAFEDEIIELGGKIYEAPRYKIVNHIQYKKWWKDHLCAHPEHRIVHGHFFSLASVYFAVAKQYGCITIGHSHCNRPDFKGWKRRIKEFIIMRTECFSDYCFACGQQAGQWLFPHKQFKVLNNAIDTDLYKYDPTIREAVRKEFGLEDSLVVGTVGSMQEVKNPFGLIDIFEAVVKRQPCSKLLWVGDGHLRIEIESAIVQKGLGKNVILTGVRSDVNRLMQAMDVFILPSFLEGLPVVAVEAQAAGLSCFFSDQVSTETDISGQCQFLPLNEPELWADKVLFSDCNRKDTLQAIIDAGYDIHTTAMWLEDFYLNLANNRS